MVSEDFGKMERPLKMSRRVGLGGMAGFYNMLFQFDRLTSVTSCPIDFMLT